ncbi:MAG: hypothetical protein AAF989_10790, partial [Planctomycetota bacterium]
MIRILTLVSVITASSLAAAQEENDETTPSAMEAPGALDLPQSLIDDPIDGDEISPRSPARSPQPSRSQIAAELRTDLDLQLERVMLARKRLTVAESKIRGAIASLDDLVEQELRRRMQSAKRDSVDKDASAQDADDSNTADSPLTSSSLSTTVRYDSPGALLKRFDEIQLQADDPIPVMLDLLTDDAIEELAALMMHQASFFSVLGQLAEQSGGVIGQSDGLPIMGPMDEAIGVQVLMDKYVVEEPSQAAKMAFQSILQNTVNMAFGADAIPQKLSRRTLRTSAGMVKSPRQFIVAASEFFDQMQDDDTDEEREPAIWDVQMDGDEAVAIDVRDRKNDQSSPDPQTELLLIQTEQGWKIQSLLSDNLIEALQTSFVNVVGQDDASVDSAPMSTPLESQNQVPLTFGPNDPPTESSSLVFYDVGAIVSGPLFDAARKPTPGVPGDIDEVNEVLKSAGADLITLLRDSLSPPFQSARLTLDHRTLIVRHTEKGHQEIKELLHQLGGDLEQTVDVRIALVNQDDINRVLGTPSRDSESEATAQDFKDRWRSLTEADDVEVAYKSVHRVRQGEPFSMAMGTSADPTVIARLVPSQDEIELRLDESISNATNDVSTRRFRIAPNELKSLTLLSESSFAWVIHAEHSPLPDNANENPSLP